MTRFALVLLAVSLLSASAHAQTIDACDAPWVDVLRMRGVLRVELDSVSRSALEGVTFVVTACSETEAEAQIVRNGRVVEQRLVDFTDVAPNLRTRLMAFVLAELVRISTALEPERRTTEPANETEPSNAAPSSETRSPSRAVTRRAPTAQRSLLDDAPPILRGRRARADEPGVRSEEFFEVERRYSMTLDTGVRWFPLEWTRAISVRARFMWRRLVIESRYSHSPVLDPAPEIVATFDAFEGGLGARVGRHTRALDFDFTAVGNFGFIRSIVPDVGNSGSGTVWSLDRCVGITLAFTFARAFSHGLVTAGFDVGYLSGTAGQSRSGSEITHMGALHGMTFGLSFGGGFGAAVTRR